jgi:predicted MPP superfamily phosphohydrolase
VWFIWLAIGLALVVAGGLYVRGRMVAAAAVLGLGRRGQRAIRWVMAWLLFAFPVIAFASVGLAIALGWGRMADTDSQLAWFLTVPFVITVLVVLQSAPWMLLLDGIRRIRRAPLTPRQAMLLLAPVAVFTIYTPARILYEYGDLRWRHYTIAAPHAQGAAIPPFRIGFIADVQQDHHFDAAQALAVMTRLAAAKPDVILSGGDWINQGPAHIAAAARTAASAPSRLGTFSVLGDHEHFAYFDRKRSVAEMTAAMRAHNVALLDNEVRRFDHHGRSIAVAFLTYSYPNRTPRAEIDRLLTSVAGADVRILVVHQLNREVAALARDRVDLILAAHTHGGQINPVIGFLHAPLARLETPYIDGRYQLGSTTIIVTAGVGYSIVPFRYASPGSVEIIDVTWRRVQMGQE